MITLTINGERREVDVPPDMPLLWVLRDVLSLTGIKFQCRIAQCGACTVHLADKPVPSSRFQFADRGYIGSISRNPTN
jgi:isoquinoline 1-oxidoreductase alpha subunit